MSARRAAATAARPSNRLFTPLNGRLQGAVPPTDTLECLHQRLRATVLQPGYPCVAGVQAIKRDDYAVGLYEGFGEGACWSALRQDLTSYLDEQERTGSLYHTMFALFVGAPQLAEAPFEEAMWRELSYLTSSEQRATDWASDAESDPSQEAFIFSLTGRKLFVVGLHPNSSRRSRRFPLTALVFNAFEQFEQLEQRGSYERMVALNRKLDVAFDGSVNPMVEQHGDRWEAIQFSGQRNADDWKCPFRFMREAEKP